MRRQAVFIVISVSLLGAVTLFHFLGVQSAPFHPDETSLLYQSRDFELLFTSPWSLAWDPQTDSPYDQTYRALNPPLPKYLFGVARRIAGYSDRDVAVDWDWSLSWEENLARGALPANRLLLAARLASTSLIPISLALIFLCGWQLDTKETGFLAALLLGTNALVLLHTRRAMAEGVLILGTSLAILGILQAHRRPWLAGLGAGIAACAKLSAGVLWLAGLVAVLLKPPADCPKNLNLARRLVPFLATSCVVFLLLNPILWSNPLAAAQEILHARLEMVQIQIPMMAELVPDRLLDTPLKRVAGMIGQVFILPPEFQEVNNYAAELEPAIESYLKVRGNSLLRGEIAGGLMLGLSLLGIGVASFRARTMEASRRRGTLLLGLASGLMALALLVSLHLPYQRYYLPLVPLAILWASLGIAHATREIKQAARQRGRPAV